ncbi:MAG: NUDIX domain-containing protein [Candidatus Andersenbacteria bacterium]
MLTCIFEDGGKGNLRHVVVDTLVLKGNKILLNKRAPRLLEGGKWGLIGGYVELNETIHEAVIREAFEETGYEISNLKLLKIVDSPNRLGEDRQNISFIFFCKAGAKKGEKDDEVTELRWFDLHALPSEDTIAFDHLESINSYKEWKRKPHPLPVVF